MPDRVPHRRAVDPEQASRPNRDPLFKGFMEAALPCDRTLRARTARWASTEQQAPDQQKDPCRRRQFLSFVSLYREAGGFSGTSLFRG